jgi:hypothetical protein
MVFVIPIWVNFGGPRNGKCWYIVIVFGIFYCHLAHFMSIWHILCPFGRFYGQWVYFRTFWYIASRKIWQPFYFNDMTLIFFLRTTVLVLVRVYTDLGFERLWEGKKQGCQICLGTKYQNGKNYTKLPRTIPNVRKILQKTVKWTKCP